MNLVILIVSSVLVASASASTDPDEIRDTFQLIVSKGYPCEIHTVTTDDGYILTVHRIPYGRSESAYTSRPTFFLQHGLLDSSATWVINSPEQSLGFMLADAGFDVWLGNVRGNLYGRKHVSLDPDSEAKDFFAFSFDEMGELDLPATINYALETSGQSQLYYAGHSQGTSMGFIQFSENSDWAVSKVKHFFALAPIFYMGHSTSPLAYISALGGTLQSILDLLGGYEFLPSSSLTEYLASECQKWLSDGPLASQVCSDALFLVAGYDTLNMNATRLPVYLSHSPAGTSTRDIAHFAQLMSSGKFQKYDYGGLFGWNNYKPYGQRYPPLYDATAIKVPVSLFYGDNDIFADKKDVEFLGTQLPNLIGLYESSDMDHLDYTWGMNAAPEVYTKIIEVVTSN